MTIPTNAPAPAQTQSPAPAPTSVADPQVALPNPIEDDHNVTIVEEKAEPRVIAVPTAAMKQIKKDAADKAMQKRQQELDADAKDLGFESHEAWRDAARAEKQRKAAELAAAPKPAAQPAAEPIDENAPETPREKKLREERDQLRTQHEQTTEDLKRRNREFSKTQREKRQLERQLMDNQTVSELKIAATQAGVIDTDYGVEVLKRAMQGMSEAEMEGFDEGKFFKETLRKSHPHLYAPENRPVNTGVKSSSAPAPGQTPPPANPEAAVDAKKLTPQEFADLLRKKGLSNPATGARLG